LFDVFPYPALAGIFFLLKQGMEIIKIKYEKV